MSDQQHITAWMGEMGWERYHYNDTLGTYGYSKSGFPMLDVDTAAFFYKQMIAARQDELFLFAKAMQKVKLDTRYDAGKFCDYGQARKDKLQADLDQLLKEAE